MRSQTVRRNASNRHYRLERNDQWIFSFGPPPRSFIIVIENQQNKPNHFTFTVALSACTCMNNLKLGERTQALVIDSDVVFLVSNDMPRRVVVAWNTIVSGYAKLGEVEMFLHLFKKMLEDSCIWTLSALMNACSEMSEPCYHPKWLEFCSGGYVKEADLVFQRMPKRNLISWTSMITGYMRNGQGECAISGQWKQAETLRKAMADKGVKKMPGCSCIEVRNRVMAFVAGSNSCSYIEQMHMMINLLESEMRFPISILCWDGIT
ncbi:hypothetical protein RD792_017206 [Penstemon davidsonii]|uniref:Pentatricopeptide repeat-containing protein n=1 Tax=Penstemon davidsonii TaxID=160366 RepID=A0ABR0CN60_9LAMI|nr:hypothetical protein RD792_017206 [Penstemon davidsonii]